ncbi:HNH endonuclease [Pseudomonas kielensis]|uniref:HNH endonuclease n=1 Tax=Pseudomonas kielensis TaxID=2762577 RepID=UPI0022403ACD|nr:HNH endonuclease [Pseudomonas kielensis]UZM14767.1 HNH endonuclease [Pseudomonas kielensis]
MANISFHDLLKAPVGSTISKKDLYTLIQYSKVPGSECWNGESLIINNTPQQGINWVGSLPALAGVLVKVRSGSYSHDGWVNSERELYRYSFKARKGVVSLKEKANLALLNQPEFGYPVVLYSEQKNNWVFEGIFGLVECADEYVILGRQAESHVLAGKVGQGFMEGGKKYVTHLLSERSSQIVKLLKSSGSWVCEICNDDFKTKYGFEYIEAHHKVPISTKATKSVVVLEDLALLCSNCHSAVHAHMRAGIEDYLDIKEIILHRLGVNI